MSTRRLRGLAGGLLCMGAGLAACSSTPHADTVGGTAGSTTGETTGGATGSTSGAGGSVQGDAASSVSSGAGGASTSSVGAGGSTTGTGGSAPTSTVRVVAYLPNYSGSYSDWAKSIDFSKMTHLDLAFATATSSNGWDMGASDQDVQAIVTAAHAAGVKVLASLGGGGGDQTVIARYKNAANVAPLVANLDTFVATLDLDGVDVDIEDPSNLGSDYTTFVSAVVAKLRPEGKLVTAAVAQYLQDSMEDATLHTFDFVNVMVYSSYSDSESAMSYYSGTKNVPSAMITLGAGFFGTDSNGNEYAYSDILAADSTAWSKDETQVKGVTVDYTGMASMKKLADYSKGFGGIMFWELSEDTTDSHSLYQVIQGEM